MTAPVASGRMATSSTRALDVLLRAGVAHTVHEYDAAHAARGDRGHPAGWGEAAAVALGVDPRRIHKTLVASVDDRLAVAIVPVAAELDLKRLATALGGRKAAMADPTAAERATGYVRGGISPLGQRRSMPTVVDSAALEHETVLVSAGRRGLQVELAPADLVRILAAIVAKISRQG
jgi:Cys-tRNA(Pro)/Cys-tRNA(Cys) deacylase